MYRYDTKLFGLELLQSGIDPIMHGDINPFITAHCDAAASTELFIWLHDRVKVEYASGIAGANDSGDVVRFVDVIGDNGQIGLSSIQTGPQLLQTCLGQLRSRPETYPTARCRAWWVSSGRSSMIM